MICYEPHFFLTLYECFNIVSAMTLFNIFLIKKSYKESSTIIPWRTVGSTSFAFDAGRYPDNILET
jgi:hypothetical protein